MKAKSSRLFAALAASVACFAAPASHAQAPPSPSVAEGSALFDAKCKSCHEPAIDRAPTKVALSAFPAADIVASLTNGKMAPMGAGLSASQMQSLAMYLAPQAPQAPTGRQAIPAVATVDTMCASNPPITAGKSDWAMAGYDISNSRYQPNPGIKAADVKKLKVKWAFSIAGHGNAQPVVIGDWMWMLSRTKMFALDPKTGCVRYRIEGVSARNTPPVFKSTLSPSGWMMIVGQGSKVVKAFDAANGKEIWASAQLEDHRASGITGSPLVSGNQVFVPLTSGEEASSQLATYPCCSFRGSLVALDLATGKTQWKTFMINEPMKPIRVASNGGQLQGPAGGAIWSTPTADPKRGLVYVATGDSYTDAPTIGADAIVALDMKTGAIRWNSQVTKDDNFIMGCDPKALRANCPTPLGPDFDFGASPILHTLPNGKQVILSGQKSSIAYGMDPDTGKVLWQYQTGVGTALGGIEWGIAADKKALYTGNSDIVNMFGAYQRKGAAPNPDIPANQVEAKPGLTAINPATGKPIWHVVPPEAPCTMKTGRYPGACFNAMSASPAVMPGVVFEGTVDGWFRAYDTAKGKLLWEHSTTAQTYATTNGVAAQPGGGIDGNGPTIAAGMVFVTSGHDGAAGVGGNGTNVLLAYSVDGK
jgi:polyvinyl alcohol dehydrogenase (cytochrome)